MLEVTQNRQELESAVEEACNAMTRWLRGVPPWAKRPQNASGTVVANRGPTIMSEADCVLHFARYLRAKGVPWENLHAEFSPGQWIYTPRAGSERPKRIDLAVIDRERVLDAKLPQNLARSSPPVLDAVFEFAFASEAQAASALRRKVDADIAKVEEYMRTNIAHLGYVVVFEEYDPGFVVSYEEDAEKRKVTVRRIRGWT